jgi:hypothetical protein
MISYRYFLAIKSAAFKKIAALSENGRDSHSAFAARAASIAAETSDGEAFEYEAIVEEWFDGFCCLEIEEVLIYGCQSQSAEPFGLLTSLPPTTIGTSNGAFFWKPSRAAVRASR